MKNILSKEKYFLLFVFLLACSIRLGYALFEQVALFSDTRHYDRIGFNISTGRGYTEQVEGNLKEDEDVIAWPPLYPFLLAFIYKLAGHSYLAVWIIQAIIGSASCLLIYFLSKQAFDEKVARLSALISAICFNLIIYSAMLLTETFYIFLVLACFVFLFKAFNREMDGWYFALAGIFAGLSALTRPVIMIFFSFFLLWGMAQKRMRKGILFFAFSIFLVISPWIIRNYFIYHRFVPIAASYGENFLLGNNPLADGEYSIDVYDSNQAYLEFSRLALMKGLKFIINNPMRFFALSARKVSIFWSLIRINGWWPYMHGFDRILSIILSSLFAVFIISFGILGAVFSFREKNVYRFWMMVFIALCPLSLVPFYVTARYRLPIYPFMIILTAYAVTLMPKIKMAVNGKGRMIMPLKIFLALIALLFLNTAYDSFVNAAEIVSRLRILFFQ